MIELWAVGLSILVVDVANPVLLTMVVLSMGTPRPYATSLMLIVGHMLAYFLAGVAIMFGVSELLGPVLEPLLHRFWNPKAYDYVVGFVLGLILLILALRWKAAPPDPQDTAQVKLNFGPGGALVAGAVVNFIGIPFAMPYFAFLNQLGKLPDGQVLLPLAIYNIGYALPFLLVPLSMAVFGKSIMPIFDKITGWVDKLSGLILPVLLGVTGLGMLVDAVLFFATGNGLI